MQHGRLHLDPGKRGLELLDDGVLTVVGIDDQIEILALRLHDERVPILSDVCGGGRKRSATKR